MEIILIAAVGAYLVGSIPFGLLVTKAAGLGDIRKIGSGNIGATNVLRTGKKWLALLTLVLDFCKSAIPVTLLFIFLASSSDHLSNYNELNFLEREFRMLLKGSYQALHVLLFTISLFTVIGHMFPIWLKFKGGKGVACIFGIAFALSPELGIICAIGWLLIFFLKGYSSLAAIIGIPWGLISFYFYIEPDTSQPTLALSLLIPTLLMIAKHHENIRRLIKGEEHRFSFSKKEKIEASLSKNEAMAIANNTLKEEFPEYKSKAELHGAYNHQTRQWNFSTPTRGSGIRIIINDADGNIVSATRWGTR